MTRVLPEGIEARFTWHPTHVTPNARFLDESALATICTLTDVDGNIVARAQAMLSPKDNFNEAIGKEIALGRALKRYVHNLEQKIQVAEAELAPEVSR
jgi:hypothetical protein